MCISGILGAFDATARSGLLRSLHSSDGQSGHAIRRVAGAGWLGASGDATAAFHGNSADRSLCLLLDGRVDNACELASALECDGTLLDAEILLRAYLKWGEDFPNHVVGDFAFALWDGSQGQLLLGRDAMGMRPLHYCNANGRLRFASTPRGLLAWTDVPCTPNEEHIAKWLSRVELGSTTFYKGIQTIPAGHVLIARSGNCRLQRYWHPERLSWLRLADPREYACGLRATLEEAVRCRVATPLKVGSYLSGGLDSSSVVALAARIFAEQGRRLYAFTAVPEQCDSGGLYPNRICDEQFHAGSVVGRNCNVDHILVSSRCMPLFQALDMKDAAQEQPSMAVSNCPWLLGVAAEAQRQGAGVLLSGQSGNFSISYDGRWGLSTLLRQWRIAALAGAAISRHHRGQSWPGIAYMAVGSQIRPAWFRSAVMRACGRPRPTLFEFSGIRQSFFAESGLPRSVISCAYDLADLPFKDGREARLALFRRVDPGMHIAALKRLFAVELRDPTADRRVVEFCLSIPDEQFCREGQPRSLIRDAMADLLPDTILQERRRGLQSADWYVSLSEARDEILAELKRMEASPLLQRCLDLHELRRLAENWPTGGWHLPQVTLNYLLKLPRSIALGRFVRRIESGEIRSAVEPPLRQTSQAAGSVR